MMKHTETPRKVSKSLTPPSFCFAMSFEVKFRIISLKGCIFIVFSSSTMKEEKQK